MIKGFNKRVRERTKDEREKIGYRAHKIRKKVTTPKLSFLKDKGDK